MNLLLLQMSIVLIVTVGCGWIARQLGQARVIGEIIGGILIGALRLWPLCPASFGKPVSDFILRAPRNALDSRPCSLPVPGGHGTGLRSALPATGDCSRCQRHEHFAPVCYGRSARAFAADSFRPEGDWQHSFCAFSWNRHEHYGLPGTGPHSGGAQASIDAA